MRGEQLSQAVGPGMVVGDENASHTYWVVPVRIANRDAVLAALRSAGFDATARSSLIIVPTVDGTSPDDSPLAPWLAETIFLPGGEDMPSENWDLLVEILQEVAFPVPSRSRVLPDLCSIPVPL